MNIESLSVLSRDGVHMLTGWIYLPDGAAKGIFQVVHGMCEYIGRYDRFMRDLCADGWIVCGHDHLGHGHTARDNAELGYIAPKDGHELLAADVGGFIEAVRARRDMFPTTDGGGQLPYVLMGHSMGSFIVRYAVERGYAKPDRLIVMGTGGPNPAAGIGLLAIGMMKKRRGDRYLSPFIEKLAFGTYNARFSGNKPEADPYEWISTDRAVRDRYRADRLCTFKFTVSAMGDLVRLSKLTNRRGAFRSMPAGMPILLVAGAEDPVGNYGKGVRTVYNRLKRAGSPVECRLYEGMRHEILNDASYEAVLKDIVTFSER